MIVALLIFILMFLFFILCAVLCTLGVLQSLIAENEEATNKALSSMNNSPSLETSSAQH